MRDPDLAAHPRLERLLAGVLEYGTWLGTCVIAAGLVLATIHRAASAQGWPLPPGMPIVAAGILLFILLPVLRVALMLIVFVLERDYRFSAIALLVLAIIFLGFVFGACWTVAPPRQHAGPVKTAG